MFKFAMTMSVVLLATLFAGACATGPKGEDNANGGHANPPGQSGPTALLVQPTLKGDIERISLGISMARESLKNNKFQEAVGQLQGANKEVDVALGRKLRLREEFEGLKTAIDRAIGAIDRHEKDADSQLAELELRIGSIKTNTP